MLSEAEIAHAEQNGVQKGILTVVQRPGEVFCIAHGGELATGTSYLGDINSAVCFSCCMTRYQMDDGTSSTTIAMLHEVFAPLFV